MGFVTEIDIEQYRLRSLPERAYYIADFITPEEEQFILDKVLTAPAPKWTTLSHRRLQAYPTQLISGVLPTNEPLPSWLADTCTRKLTELGIWAESPHKTANHCLINEYEPGQGIMPHEDGDAYYPLVATVSLRSQIVLEVIDKSTRQLSHRILQEPRSLLITTEKVYNEFLHGIRDIKTDNNLTPESVANWSSISQTVKDKITFNHGSLPRENTRISLTFRDVNKVRNLISLLYSRKK
ncbi:hypothetical protein V1514DRAFT_354305 [Lipomyces japonicus]|uniref:uncharacterized protein n=1 Tax=Lipomyces japonicus TaxID=56871 RepID=UPI0034CEC1BA